MNGPGGNRSRATAAYGSFPYPMRTVAEIDAAEIEAKITAKARRELNGLMMIERANRLRPILRGHACGVGEIMAGRA